MPLSTKPVRSTPEATRFPASLMSRDVTTSPMPSTNNPSQLLLMLPTGHHTEVESSTTVPAQSTTESSWLPPPHHTGPSRTLGEPLGESLDSSDLPRETPVPSVTTVHIQESDTIYQTTSNIVTISSLYHLLFIVYFYFFHIFIDENYQISIFKEKINLILKTIEI